MLGLGDLNFTYNTELCKLQNYQLLAIYTL